MSDSFVFPSSSSINKEFFGGSSSNNVNPEEVKKEVEQQKETENKSENDQKQNQSNKQESNQKQEETQQQNLFRENSIKSLKDLGFETKDDKKFFRKIKQFEVQIELP